MSGARKNTLSVLVPIFNESRTVLQVLNTLSSVELPHNLMMEIVLVNDCSTDNSGELCKEFIAEHSFSSVEVKYYEHQENSGKGAALHTGIAEATGDFIVVQDADLEYDPNEFAVLLKPILEDRADVVYGSRFLESGRRGLLNWHTFGNRFLTFLSNIWSGLKLSDMETCYKLFRADLLKGLVLYEKRFGFEPEVTIKLSHIPNIRVIEVPISYDRRGYDEGKKIGWRDGFEAIYCIVKYGLGTKLFGLEKKG